MRYIKTITLGTLMLQIIQEVLLETPGPSTAHCIASEPAVAESEIEVQVSLPEKLAVLLSKLLSKEGMQRYTLRQEQVQRVSKVVLYSCAARYNNTCTQYLGAAIQVKPAHEDASVQCELLRGQTKTFGSQCDIWRPAISSSPVICALSTSESEFLTLLRM